MVNTIDFKVRKENIYLLRKDGMTFQAIADLYGISGPRVAQIFNQRLRYDQTLAIRRESAAQKIIENDNKLHSGDVMALADYLRHKISVNNPKDQYLLDMAANTIEKLQKRINKLSSCQDE